jgi:hypothetical protein
MVVLLTTPTNSADFPIAEQTDQLEHRIKAGLARLLAAWPKPSIPCGSMASSKS